MWRVEEGEPLSPCPLEAELEMGAGDPPLPFPPLQPASFPRVQNLTSWLFPSVKCDTLPVPQQPHFGKRASELLATRSPHLGETVILAGVQGSPSPSVRSPLLPWPTLAGACPSLWVPPALGPAACRTAQLPPALARWPPLFFAPRLLLAGVEGGPYLPGAGLAAWFIFTQKSEKLRERRSPEEW